MGGVTHRDDPKPGGNPKPDGNKGGNGGDNGGKGGKDDTAGGDPVAAAEAAANAMRKASAEQIAANGVLAVTNLETTGETKRSSSRADAAVSNARDTQGPLRNASQPS